jgi:hypothetical protein
MSDTDSTVNTRSIETGTLVIDQHGDTLRYGGTGEDAGQDPFMSRVVYDSRHSHPTIKCNPHMVAPADAVPELKDLDRKDPRITVANDKAGRPNTWSGSWRSQIPGDLNPRWFRTKGEATAEAARRLAIAGWWAAGVQAAEDTPANDANTAIEN